MDRLRTVVCGTTFGRVYAAGIRLLPSRYDLVGLLSRGSEQSREYAREQRVPLCTRIEDLPEFDLACVVVRSGIVGGSGSQLARRFLEAGKHVVLEHPIHREDALACYRAASGSGRVFLVNPFYRHSPTIKTYLGLVQALRADHGIVCVQAECSVQFLFSMVDVLGRIVGGFTPWAFDPRTGESGVFTSVSGSFRDVPVTLRVVNRMNPASPDDFAHVGHRITVFTQAGNLVLTETDGQILWHPNILVPRGPSGVLEIDERLSSAALHEAIAVEPDVTRRGQFERIWPAAVAEFLDLAHREIERPTRAAREAEYTLTLCSVWSRVGQLIGPSEALGCERFPDHLCLERLGERAANGASR